MNPYNFCFAVTAFDTRISEIGTQFYWDPETNKTSWSGNEAPDREWVACAKAYYWGHQIKKNRLPVTFSWYEEQGGNCPWLFEIYDEEQQSVVFMISGLTGVEVMHLVQAAGIENIRLIDQGYPRYTATR